MLGLMIVCYLFLGGAGAGAIATASLVNLVAVRARFGMDSCVSVDEAPPEERSIAYTMAAGLAILILGVLCLLFDLGRIDRALSLFLSPTLSYISIGSFALVALIALAAVQVVVRFLYMPFISTGFVRAVEMLAVAAALAVMFYTGLLLQSAGGVPFWDTPLVPLLFCLSSASCGMGIYALSALFAGEPSALSRMIELWVTRIDMTVIILELIAAIAFIIFGLSSGNPAAKASANLLVEWPYAAMWWLGLVGCGLVFPFVAEIVHAMRVVQTKEHVRRTVLAIAAVGILVGGFCLRSGIVEAGMQRGLTLESPGQQATSDAFPQTFDNPGVETFRLE